jgi:ABC-type uncharacterized transport system ATPase subunit
MIGLTDNQLRVVMNAARLLPVEKRDTFLQRIAAMLALGRILCRGLLKKLRSSPAVPRVSVGTTRKRLQPKARA